MIRPFFIAVITICLVPLTSSCLITSQELETLKEQVRLEQEAVVDLQRRLEERSMQLDGMENSLQMLQARIEDNAKRLEDMETMLSTEAPPAREFVLAPKEEPPAAAAPPPRVAAPPPVRTAPPPKIAAPPPEVAAPPPVRTVGEEEREAEEKVTEIVEDKERSAYVPRAYGSGADLYQSAYEHFEKGDFGQAILEFEEYVANYRSTDLADNAQYWIGECYYAQKDYRQAIREFDKVERNFPQGNKLPASKIKKGFAYREMGNLSEALRELQEVADRYPSTEEAVLAREKIKVWK